MKKQEVIEFYGGVRAAARALGLGKSTVSEWKEEIPSSRQDHVRLAMQEEQRRRDAEEKKAKRKADRGNRAQAV